MKRDRELSREESQVHHSLKLGQIIINIIHLILGICSLWNYQPPRSNDINKIIPKCHKLSPKSEPITRTQYIILYIYKKDF
jgi:hypothetical protein